MLSFQRSLSGQFSFLFFLQQKVFFLTQKTTIVCQVGAVWLNYCYLTNTKKKYIILLQAAPKINKIWAHTYINFSASTKWWQEIR